MTPPRLLCAGAGRAQTTPNNTNKQMTMQNQDFILYLLLLDTSKHLDLEEYPHRI
jgi:hypothetical protein